MNAGIVLCAGFGTRLKPVTDEVPKPAIPFLNKPMVWYALNCMKNAHIINIAANVHHLPDKMAACLEHCAHSLELPQIRIYREQNEILGTGGGARACMSLLPDADRFVIYHGDVLCGTRLENAIDAHIASGCDITLVVAPRPENSKLGMVGVDHNDDVMRIRDWYRAGCDASTPFKPCCFTGIHIVERRILETLPKETNICLVTEIYPAILAAGGRIHAFETSDFFADVGTPETYLEAQRQILSDPTKLPGAEIWSPDPENAFCVRKPVSLAKDVALDAHSIIGPNVCIGSGAHIQPGEHIQDEMRFEHYRIHL